MNGGGLFVLNELGHGNIVCAYALKHPRFMTGSVRCCKMRFLQPERRLKSVPGRPRGTGYQSLEHTISSVSGGKLIANLLNLSLAFCDAFAIKFINMCLAIAANSL